MLMMDLPLIEPRGDSAAQRQSDARRLRGAALSACAFLALLWWIHLFQHFFGEFPALALYPRSLAGSIGILTAPLLHGSFEHLVSNSLPLLLLITLSLLVVPRAAKRGFVLIWLLSGLLVWLFARDSGHIGASGIDHGLMFFLFVIGIARRDRPAVAAALIAFFMYGGMVLSILPNDPQISWEYHLGGALAGTLSALLWRRLDPAPARKHYDWEDDDQDAAAGSDDPLEPARPDDVPVLWQRPQAPTGQILPFPKRPPPRNE